MAMSFLCADVDISEIWVQVDEGWALAGARKGSKNRPAYLPTYVGDAVK
jgi:hypothetical protein